MSVADFLFQGSPPPAVSSSSSTSTTTNLPEWYQSYLQGLMGRSNAIAGADYQPYQGPRIADFSPEQQQAFDLAKGNVGSTQPMLGEAADMTKASGTFDPAKFSTFQSPYQQGVLDVMRKQGMRTLNEDILPQTDSTFISAGQPQSTRHLDARNQMMQRGLESIDSAQAQYLDKGFSDSMANYNTWADNQGQAGQNLGTLAQTMQGANAKDAATLEAIGSQKQTMGQNSLNTAYDDFTRQRDYPKDQASFMNSMIRGLQVPSSTSTTTSGTAPYSGSSMSPSPFATLAGLGSLMYGANSAGLFGDTFKADGGRIPEPSYRRGGPVRRVHMYRRGGSVRRAPMTFNQPREMGGSWTRQMAR